MLFFCISVWIYISFGSLVNNYAPFSIPFCYGLSIEYFSIKMEYEGITEVQKVSSINFTTIVGLFCQNLILLEVRVYTIEKLSSCIVMYL